MARRRRGRSRGPAWQATTTTMSPATVGRRDIAGAATYAAKPLVGGRQTQPTTYNPWGLSVPWAFIPKKQLAMVDLTEVDITAFSSDQLLSLLPDLDPTISKAVWNYMREAGTQITFEALTLDQQEDKAGQAILDDLVMGINAQSGGIAGVIRQLQLTAYLQGAACADVAPTKNLRDLDDLYVVNPDTIYFERDMDQVAVPFQQQQLWHASGTLPFRLLNTETFIYVPVDPFVDDPYGRSPIAPALQVVFALAAVLRDLQKVIHHQGWPKIDISLVWELMEATVPDAVKQDEQRLQDWVGARIGEVVAAYNAMRPEDAFIHQDYVRVDSGAAAAGTKLFDVSAIVQIFQSQLIQACKSLPIFHGGNASEGSTETYGTVEFEIYVASVEVLREIVAEVLVRALTVALQLRGHQGLVRHEWAPLKRAARLTDAQAVAQEIENAVNQRDQGFTTQDDASRAITGSDAVAPPPSPSAMPMAPPSPAPQVIYPPEDEGDTAATAVTTGRGSAWAYLAAAARAQLEDAGRNGHHRVRG